MQSQLVCSGCRSILVYPRGAANVCCAICNAVTTVPPPGISYLLCFLSYFTLSRCFHACIFLQQFTSNFLFKRLACDVNEILFYCRRYAKLFSWTSSQHNLIKHLETLVEEINLLWLEGGNWSTWFFIVQLQIIKTLKVLIIWNSRRDQDVGPTSLQWSKYLCQYCEKPPCTLAQRLSFIYSSNYCWIYMFQQL